MTQSLIYSSASEVSRPVVPEDGTVVYTQVLPAGTETYSITLEEGRP